MGMSVSVKNIRDKHGCPECASINFTISKLESRVNFYKEKYLQALGNLMKFVSMQQPQMPGGHTHATDLHPNDSPIVNSQVTDVHPDGTATVSQSSNHHPTGVSDRPSLNSHTTLPPWHHRPGSWIHHWNGTNLKPGRRPIVNSQVTDMHPDGSISVSQSTNLHPAGVSDRPSMNSHEQLNALFKPRPTRPTHSEEKPIVNSQVTNLHPNRDKPVINSQVTEF